MPNQVQALRSSTTQNRPTGRLPGELYVNYADNQLGVINPANAALDLIAVRYFSTTANYFVGDHAIYQGIMYRALAPSNAGAFVSANWSPIGGSVTVSDTPPTNPQNGQLWFDSVGGQLYVFYNDGNSSQWVIAVNIPPGSSGGGGGTTVSVGDTAPTNPTVGSLWWDSTAGQLYIWYNDGTSSQWAPTTNQFGGGYLPLTGGTMTGLLTLSGNATASFGAVTLAQMQAGDALNLPLTGGTLTGTLNGTSAVLSGNISAQNYTANAGYLGLIAVSAGTGSNITMAKPPGAFANQILGYTGAPATASIRWNMQIGDSTAESGSNLGTNFSISRYNDAGTYVDTPFKMMRQDGTIIIGGARGGAGLGAGAGVSWSPSNGMVVETGTAAFNSISTNRAAAGQVLNMYYGGGAGGSISQAAGGVVSFNTGSDARSKTNEQSFDAGPILDAIMVYDFEWIDSGTRAYGVMAQECNEVFPDAVYHHEPEDTWGVDYSKFVPLLLQEIKALRVRVAQLEAAQ